MDNVERINLVFGYAKPVPASSGLTIEGPLRNHRGLVFELLLVCIKDRERERKRMLLTINEHLVIIRFQSIHHQGIAIAGNIMVLVLYRMSCTQRIEIQFWRILCKNPM